MPKATDDNNIVDGLKDAFTRWAVTKSYADRICWEGNALEVTNKKAPWFAARILPMKPVNRIRGMYHHGIFTIDVIVKANTGLTVLRDTKDLILATFPKGGYFFKNQQYNIVLAYADASYTDGACIVQPVLIDYEGTVFE